MGKHHSQEYKEYVSKLVVEEGRKATEVAYELEIPYKTLIIWVKAYREKLNSKKTDYITPKELEELKKQHEREIERLREENEILKKAMHIFTKSQK
ncbi:transposase [Ferdinandcohnia quinoae]|uniref:Transposase n=1 Tax=Fredinandcohnia quinoae TaxID=2918902 RepID=A0AAW5E4X9_9BACI|nr:transposase [Fredinandcohnia sp. SECRCQ15]MCH1627991.1 transposase [Fredinandcohnia sp. SECRCQ15]